MLYWNLCLIQDLTVSCCYYCYSFLPDFNKFHYSKCLNFVPLGGYNYGCQLQSGSFYVILRISYLSLPHYGFFLYYFDLCCIIIVDFFTIGFDIINVINLVNADCYYHYLWWFRMSLYFIQDQIDHHSLRNVIYCAVQMILSQSFTYLFYLFTNNCYSLVIINLTWRQC